MAQNATAQNTNKKSINSAYHKVFNVGNLNDVKLFKTQSYQMTYSPGVIGFNLEQISNKLKISGSVQKNALNNISKVP